MSIRNIETTHFDFLNRRSRQELIFLHLSPEYTETVCLPIRSGWGVRAIRSQFFSASQLALIKSAIAEELIDQAGYPIRTVG